MGTAIDSEKDTTAWSKRELTTRFGILIKKDAMNSNNYMQQKDKIFRSGAGIFLYSLGFMGADTPEDRQKIAWHISEKAKEFQVF